MPGSAGSSVGVAGSEGSHPGGHSKGDTRPGEDDDDHESPWSASLSLGGVGFAGNTESVTLSAGVDMGLAGRRWVLSFVADGKRVSLEREDGTNEHERHEDYEIESQVRRKFGSRYYALLKASWDRRPRSDIDYEIHAGPGLGVHLVRSKELSLQGNAGLTYSDVRRVQDASQVRYASYFLHTALRWSWQPGTTLSWRNDLKVGSGAGSDLKSDQEVDLKTALSRWLSLKVGLEWEYDSHPSHGVLRSDYSFTVGLAVTPWGDPGDDDDHDDDHDDT